MKKYYNLLPILFLFLTSCKQEEAQKITYGDVCKSIPRKVSESSEFIVNKSSIETQLFSENTSILLGINKVYQAKNQVNIARASLFPSLNLSALLYSAANPTFAFSAVNVMLPFLAPSNWAKYRESKELALAQVDALRAIKYNTYASAISTYAAIETDLKLLEIYNQEVKDITQIYSVVEKLYNSGLASKSDMDRAQGTLSMSEVGMSKIEGLINKEIAEFRKILSLGLDKKIIFEPIQIIQTESEEFSKNDLSILARKRSPEMSQIQKLKKAAEEQVWGGRFAFIGGGNVQSPASNGNGRSISFDNLSSGVQFNIGFSQVPIVKLSQDRLEEIKLREKEIILEISERAEYALSFVEEAKSRSEYAQKASFSFESIYKRDLIRYEFGQVDLFTLLDTRSKFRESKIEQLRAELQLKLNRIVLQRLLVENDFERLFGCDYKK